MFDCQIFGLLVNEKRTYSHTFFSSFCYSALSLFVLYDKCILWNTVLPVWLLGGKSQDTLSLQGWSLNTIPKSEKFTINDEVECGWSLPLSRVHPVKTSSGGGELHSFNHLRTRGLYLFLGTAPASHTCTIPPECLVTSFSQRAMYTCVLGHLYLSCRHSHINYVVPRDKDLGNMVRKPTEA